MKIIRHKKVSFIIVLAVPLIILLSLTIKPLWTLSTGEEITLQTIPVDPRDLLYGDYVTLRYEIEEVPKEKLTSSLLNNIESHRSNRPAEVYGILVKVNNHYQLESLTDEKPSDVLYLTGQLNRFSYVNDKDDVIYNVDFNLERFFVPENSGVLLEDLSRKGQLVAHIKVKNGYAILRDIQPVE